MNSPKEREFINSISKKYCINNDDKKILGIGDDCAYFKADNNLIVTTDMLVEGTHFDLSVIWPGILGKKSALVNISDISAMGGKPLYAFVSVGYKNQTAQFLDEFYKGLFSVFNENGVLILGGDTVKSEKFVVNITLIGKVKKPILRSGAKSRDVIIVSDYCGLSHAGLDALFKYKANANKIYEKLVHSHLLPRVSVELGVALKNSGKVHSMMDLSDGLNKDLYTLCEASGVGAEIDLKDFLVNQDLKAFCDAENKNINDYLLGNFEDYTLLLTCSKKDMNEIMDLITKYGFTPSCIGRITKEPGIVVKEKKITYNMPAPWEHF